jgi:hypothetical protein
MAFLWMLVGFTLGLMAAMLMAEWLRHQARVTMTVYGG